MTGAREPDGCADARRALLSNPGSVPPAHVAVCADCARFRKGLLRVDAALETAALEAGKSRLPAELRARVLAAAGTGAARTGGRSGPRGVSEPRGRLLELMLRAGAVAAVLTGIAFALPEALWAAELDADAVGRWTGRIEQALRAPDAVLLDTTHLSPALLPLDVPPVEHAGAVGIVALALLSSGVGLVLRERAR